MQPSIPVCQARPPTWAESDSATRVSRAKCRSREPHTTNSVTAAHQHRRHGDHERETGVGHPSEASGRIQEPQENRKSTTKSLPPLAGGSNPGKTESPQQRVGHPCKPAGGSRNPWENGKSTTNSPSRNPKTLKETPNQD